MSAKGYPGPSDVNDTGAVPGLNRGRSSINLESQEADSQMMPHHADSMPADSLEVNPPESQAWPEDLMSAADDLPQSSQPDECDGEEGEEGEEGEDGANPEEEEGEEESSSDDDDIPFYQMAFHSDGTVHHEGAALSMESLMFASMISDWLGARAALKVATGRINGAATKDDAEGAGTSSQDKSSKGSGAAKSKAKKAKKSKQRKGKFNRGKKN